MLGRSPFFCSDLSRSVSESTFGTASRGDAWLLLEYPYAWERKAFEDSFLSSRVKEFLRSSVSKLPRARLLLIKTERPMINGISFYVVRSSECAPLAVKFRLDNYEQVAELDIVSTVAGDVPANGEILDGPLFLVCTHGRRDKCCAKFGYPLYKALRASTDQPVWQSSHVGGDRFAANLVCLPHGLFYAHVTDESGRQIIEEYRSGNVELNKYRGRTCYSKPVQAAEFFVRSETGISGVEDLRYSKAVLIEANRWRVEFVQPSTDTTYEADVSVRPSEFRNFKTCDGALEKPVPQFVLNSCRAIISVG